jgi:hypothetical protein
MKLVGDTLRNGFKDYSLPSRDDLLAEAWRKVWENLDLNSSDAVLLYSGILQAVPLVGAAFKFTSILNRAARNLAKSFKKKPFTTVVKSLISADFIDRFVISPTIDDARKFINAHNYVVNVVNTAYTRSGALPTAIKQSAHADIDVPKVFVDSVQIGPSSGMFVPATNFATVRSRSRHDITTDVFLLANLAYNTDAIDPIKIWMNRCGITRPLDSVWDLIPFSFVIDYFTRAGEFISGLSDRMAESEGLKGSILSIIGAYAQTKCFNGMEYDIKYPEFTTQEGGICSTTDGKLTYGSYLYDRGPSNPYAYPLSDPSGLIRMDLSQTRLRTLLELIIQAKA